MQFKPVMNKTVLYADNSKSHASLGYLQKTHGMSMLLYSYFCTLNQSVLSSFTQ